jgi:thioredoxin-like negative regulator of GroEL
LFGVDPQAYAASQNEKLDAQAIQFAQLDPFQKASYGLYKGGAQLGNVGAQLLGAQDPMLQKASALKQIASQFDTTTPQGLMAMAKAAMDAGYSQEAQRAVAAAQQMQVQNATIHQKMADKIKQVGLSESGQQVYQSGDEQYILGQGGQRIPYYGKFEGRQATTTNKITVEAAKNVLEIDKKDVENAVKVRDTAEQVIPRLQEQASALQRGIIAGSFADSRTAIATAFTSLGINDPKLVASLANSKGFKSTSTALASSVAKELGVNPTDRDFEAARDRFAKNSDDPQASAMFISDMLKIKQRDYSNATGLIQHFRQTGGSLTGYDRPVPKSPLVSPLTEMSTEELLALQKQKRTPSGAQ